MNNTVGYKNTTKNKLKALVAAGCCCCCSGGVLVVLVVMIMMKVVVNNGDNEGEVLGNCRILHNS